MKRVYISGAMTGIADFNHPAFFAAEMELRARGYYPVNPARNGIKPNWQWCDYMRKDIAALMTCDYIYLLDGWENSRGASLEVFIATQLNIPILKHREESK